MIFTQQTLFCTITLIILFWNDLYCWRQDYLIRNCGTQGWMLHDAEYQAFAILLLRNLPPLITRNGLLHKQVSSIWSIFGLSLTQLLKLKLYYIFSMLGVSYCLKHFFFLIVAYNNDLVRSCMEYHVMCINISAILSLRQLKLKPNSTKCDVWKAINNTTFCTYFFPYL